jgi:hypothetical protein
MRLDPVLLPPPTPALPPGFLALQAAIRRAVFLMSARRALELLSRGEIFSPPLIQSACLLFISTYVGLHD